MKKAISIILVLFLGLISFVGCDDKIKDELLVKSVGVLTEYGVYFGLKAANIPEDKAKIGEESLRVVVKVAENDSVDDFVDVEAILNRIDPQIMTLIKPTLDKIDGKYVDLKNKIPQDKMPLIISILKGAFRGTENYRVYLSKNADTTEAEIQSISVYEKKLTEEYLQCKDKL